MSYTDSNGVEVFSVEVDDYTRLTSGATLEVGRAQISEGLLCGPMSSSPGQIALTCTGDLHCLNDTLVEGRTTLEGEVTCGDTLTCQAGLVCDSGTCTGTFTMGTCTAMTVNCESATALSLTCELAAVEGLTCQAIETTSIEIEAGGSITFPDGTTQDTAPGSGGASIPLFLDGMSQGNLLAIHLDRGLDPTQTMMRMVTDSGSAYFPLTGAPRPFVVRMNPDPVIPGVETEVRYKAYMGPLASALEVHMHTGFNVWSLPGPSIPMVYDPLTNEYVGTVLIDPTAEWFDMAFHDNAGTWDNNGGNDWHFRTRN